MLKENNKFGQSYGDRARRLREQLANIQPIPHQNSVSGIFAAEGGCGTVTNNDNSMRDEIANINDEIILPSQDHFMQTGESLGRSDQILKQIDEGTAIAYDMH